MIDSKVDYQPALDAFILDQAKTRTFLAMQMQELDRHNDGMVKQLDKMAATKTPNDPVAAQAHAEQQRGLYEQLIEK